MNARCSLVVALMVCASLSPRALADDKKPDPKPKEIDKATVAAWEERGLKPCWLTTPVDPKRPVAALWEYKVAPKDEKHRDNWIPAFSSEAGDLGRRGSLPDVDMPFGVVITVHGRFGVNLNPILELEHLAYLKLKRGAEDAHLEYVAELKELTHLDLSGCAGIRGTGLKHVARMKKLTYLNLEYTGITGTWLRDLAGLEKLTALNLEYIGGNDDERNDANHAFNLTDAGLKNLKGLQQLRHLSLNGNRRLTDSGLKHLAELKSLATLGLSRVGEGEMPLTDAGLKHLSGLSSLTHLDLSRTEVTGTGLKELAALKHLASLDLSRTKVTDAGLKHISDLSNLTRLNLGDTKVTDAALMELAKLTQLTELEIHGTMVTNAGVTELQKVLPKCKIEK